MSTPLATSKKRPKSELEDDQNDDDCCGICYMERGVPVPGKIDSCNHYFCFVCIMEWAKHESRCPICRQRFSNVRRLPKHGVFSYHRDIKVPIRDQVILFSTHSKFHETLIWNKFLNPNYWTQNRYMILAL
jgi:PHD and RING finger domain-containing protein 1